MIKTRLIEQVPSSKKYIALTVLAQWLKTVANIVMIFILSNLLAQILDGKAFDFKGLLPYLGAIAAVMLVRYLCGYASSQTAFFASSEVKKVLRQKMYKKLTRMGASYSEKVSTSEVLQVFVEGVDQLELYFGTDNAFCRACVRKLESVGGASYLCTPYSAFYCCSSKNRKKTS